MGINPNHKPDQGAVIMLNGSSTVAGTEDGSQYHCPITGLEMNGRYKFCFFLTCGCVMSERAYHNVTDGFCPSCGDTYSKYDCIHINPIATEVKKLQKEYMEERRLKRHDEKRDIKLREKLQVDDNLPPSDKIADWLTSQAERRRSSDSSTGFEFQRRTSIISATSATSLGEHEDKQSRKRRLEEWAQADRRKSIGDLEKQKKLKFLRSKLLAKKASLLQQLKEESSEEESDTETESD